jgi:microcompartment protein CcmK/EutM
MMRVGEVIGKVVLSRSHPDVAAGTWLVVVPLMASGLAKRPEGREEPIVVYDELGASPGALIGMSEGAEAGAPFHPNPKPLDAYNACILDTLELDETLL